MNPTALNAAADGAQRALAELQGAIGALERALRAADWAPQQTRDSVRTQIDELRRIMDEIGPRLVQRIRDGDKSRIEALRDLLVNVDRNARETAQSLEAEFGTGPLLEAFLVTNYEDLKEIGKKAVQISTPLVLIGAAAVFVYLVKK